MIWTCMRNVVKSWNGRKGELMHWWCRQAWEMWSNYEMEEKVSWCIDDMDMHEKCVQIMKWKKMWMDDIDMHEKCGQIMKWKKMELIHWWYGQAWEMLSNHEIEEEVNWCVDDIDTHEKWCQIITCKRNGVKSYIGRKCDLMYWEYRQAWGMMSNHGMEGKVKANKVWWEDEINMEDREGSIKSSSEGRRVLQKIDEWSRCNTKSLTQKDIQKWLFRDMGRLLISAGQFGTKNEDIVISDVLDISWTWGRKEEVLESYENRERERYYPP